jgi:hypothetical protein
MAGLIMVKLAGTPYNKPTWNFGIKNALSSRLEKIIKKEKGIKE